MTDQNIRCYKYNRHLGIRAFYQKKIINTSENLEMEKIETQRDESHKMVICQQEMK